jgi:hypothetical protein
MTGLEIAALIAMLAGSAMQYKANTDAARRQEQQTREALARQDGLQRSAEKRALTTAGEFSTDKRAADQAQIEADLTQEFVKPVESAQQINASQSTTQGNVSKDYTAAKAASSVRTMKTAEALARLLGKTTAAGRLRTNESIKVADAAADIDRLGSFSRGQAGADQIAIQAAGRPNAELMLGGSMLQAAGGATLAGGSDGTIGKLFGGGGGNAAGGMSATAGGLGFKGIGSTGFRMPVILGG